jgi:hypothetical protein
VVRWILIQATQLGETKYPAIGAAEEQLAAARSAIARISILRVAADYLDETARRKGRRKDPAVLLRATNVLGEGPK